MSQNKHFSLRGEEKFKTMLGEKNWEVIQKITDISPDFAQYIVDMAYGDIFYRPGFSDKDRELAAVCCMIGQSNLGLPLKAHLRGMMKTGWTKQEIIELMIHLTAYVGFPNTVSALMLADEVFKEME
jgi:4-carboxymuconolactone decarboxylase